MNFRGLSIVRNRFTIRVVLAKLTLSIAILSSAIISTANLASADRYAETSTQIAQSDRWTSQIREQLMRAASAAGAGGFTLTHQPFIGDLGNGGEDDITLSLRRGVSYTILGVCDEDCTDIDLRLYDDNGNVISSDVESNDIPVVRVTPRWNARFTIRVYMPNCSNAPCRYGIGVFGK
jgi:hypothetical protein